MMETPEQRLANRIVESNDLAPPVDIIRLTRLYAKLEVVDWPYECDGLTVGLTDVAGPKIFIKDIKNSPRQRFTIAHELGHVLLPWHIEEVACSPETGGLSASFGGGLREREASTFASHVLIPDRFLQPLCVADPDIPTVINAVEQADISASASLIALARALPPGIAFVLESSRVFHSRGTVLPTSTYEYWRHRIWSTAASSSGRVRLRGKSVRWFKLEQFREPREITDPRETTQLLKDAIASVTDDSREQRNLLNIVNGVIGAAMTQDNRASPTRALATMRHRLRARPDLMELLQEPDFELFLERRAVSHSEE